jgi:hypothetical protein
VLENLRADYGASESHHRDYANQGTTAHGRDHEQECCRKQQRRFGYQVKHAGVQLDDFPTQSFAAKIGVVIELMSPGRTDKDKIAGHQQHSANRSSQQEPPLNSPVGSITHLDLL